MLALNGTEIGEVHFYLTGGRESENLGGLTISSRGRGDVVYYYLTGEKVKIWGG